METNQERQTLCGIPVKSIYTPEDIKDLNYDQSLGFPGEAPYTRGAYPNMYRDRLWRIFELSGYGKPEESGELAQFLSREGANVVFFYPDRTTTWLYDVDHPVVADHKDEVGSVGTPYMSLRDYEEALEGIQIENIYCHPGAAWPPVATFIHSCYFSVAEQRGIPLSKLYGTGESCYFINYMAQLRDDLIPPHISIRLDCDMIEYCLKNVPKWVPVSIPGYNARECGVNAYQELALILANAIAYIEELLRRGRLKIDDFAHSLGGIAIMAAEDFFETVCSMRAARRMWTKLLKERYGAQEPNSLRLRIHSLVKGSGFTYQQPMNNIIRGTYQGLAAALGGVQSMGVPRFDEAISIPSREGFIMAVRTQQILQLESNITNVVDPLAGSYYVEWLTDEIEKRAWGFLQEIEQQGGFIPALESGWIHRIGFHGAIAEAQKLETGERKKVGVNCFQMEEEPFKIPIFKTPPGTWEETMAKLEKVRKERDPKQVEQALADLRRACETDENVMEVMMRVVKAYVTVGEVGEVFRDVFGTWRAPSLLG